MAGAKRARLEAAWAPMAGQRFPGVPGGVQPRKWAHWRVAPTFTHPRVTGNGLARWRPPDHPQSAPCVSFPAFEVVHGVLGGVEGRARAPCVQFVLVISPRDSPPALCDYESHRARNTHVQSTLRSSLSDLQSSEGAVEAALRETVCPLEMHCWRAPIRSRARLEGHAHPRPAALPAPPLRLLQRVSAQVCVWWQWRL